MKGSRTFPVLMALALGFSGCASYVATVRKTAKRTVLVQAADYDAAFDAALKAASEAGFSVRLQQKEKGLISADRGRGYVEASRLLLSMSRDIGGTVSMTAEVHSSHAGEPVLDRFLSVYKRYAQVR